MRVLGVDPGTIVAGWAVIDCQGRAMTRVAAGSIRVGRAEVSERLGRVYAELVRVIGEYAPDHFSLERSFVSRNVQSALRLGEARGVAMAAAASAKLTMNEYSPATIKKAVVGYGRADKAQVQAAVVRLFGLCEEPPEDEADALAIAACHGFSCGMLGRIHDAVAAEAGVRGKRAAVGDGRPAINARLRRALR